MKLQIDVKDKNGRDYAQQLQGQAGVWAVASKLALAGHVPMFPGVDYGYDLLIENGLRLQVKSGWMRTTNPGYPGGAYIFDVRKRTQRYRSGGQLMQRTISQKVEDLYDFVICWGINEDRFWVIPSSEVSTNVSFTSREAKFLNKKYNTAKRLEKKNARLVRYEERWDLLSTDQVVEELVESSVPKETT